MSRSDELGTPPVRPGDLITWSGRNAVYKVTGVHNGTIRAHFYGEVNGDRDPNKDKDIRLEMSDISYFAWCDHNCKIVAEWTPGTATAEHLIRKAQDLVHMALQIPTRSKRFTPGIKRTDARRSVNSLANQLMGAAARRDVDDFA